LGSIDPQPGGAESGHVRDRLDELLGARTAREIALVTRLAGGFPDRATAAVHDLLDAATLRDAELIGRRAHTLRGACANLGAVRLPDLCSLIEELAATGSFERVLGLRAALDQAVDHLGAALREAWAPGPQDRPGALNRPERESTDE
jgi:HPt (histidine-containing phosphotransfer) domain-containing protein